MRYEDASQTSGLSQTQSQPIDARDDSDALTAGSRGPATGNTITGDGTQTGSVGADLANSGAKITAISGAGGSDSSFAGGKLQVGGEFGRLSIDAEGNYNYIANANTPENSRDRFTYTLADSQGNSDTANLTIEFGKTQSAIQANAQQVVPGPDGVVILPPGVELSDIRVVGRNLVIDLPDGTQMVIVDGAVFVPQLVLGTVEVPADNLAALLIGQEPQPAAGGQLLSSGGNFAVPVGPLDPGVPLGDLLPPTALSYQPPEVDELFDILDREPEVVIVTPDQPAGAEDATASVNEAALGPRGAEPQGSGEEAAAGPNGDPRETTTGTIVIDSPDEPNSTTINGVLVTGVGQVIPGTFGSLTITSITDDAIGYSYTLTTDTSGDTTSDLFTVVVTDNDGDTDTATLTVSIIDDVPTARPDTDSIAAGAFAPATGNVITDASAGDVGDSDTNAADTVGADNASVTSVSGAGGSDSTFDGSGNLVVNGQFGVLTIQADGSYSYARNPGSQGGVTDTFNYTLTDGDGDTSTSTLTISIGDESPTLTVPVQGEAGTQVSEVGLPTRNGEPAGSGEAADGNGADNDDTSETTAGTISFTQGDGPATVSIDGTAVTSVGQTFTVVGVGVLTITSIAPGAIGYSFTLTDNTSGDNTSVTFGVSVSDQDGDTASSDLVIRITDDTPTARDDADSVTEDGPLSTDGNVISGANTDSGAMGADTPGADGAAVQAPGSYNGSFGTLVINADGSYVYTLYTAAQNAAAAAAVQGLSAGDTLSDSFGYVLVDGDGDTDPATLVITINGADDGVTINGLDGQAPEEVVREDDLADGSSPDAAALTQGGTFSFTAGDGLNDVTVGGVLVIDGGVFVGPQAITDAKGTLTITGFTPLLDANGAVVGGTLSYTYVLTDNTLLHTGADDAALTQSFAVVVNDVDGSSDTDSLDVQIIDDVPTGVDDSASQTAENANVTIDVFANDIRGADGAVASSVQLVPGSQVGAGTLTNNGDGTFTLDPDPGQTGIVTFQYSFLDLDGDVATATATITLLGDTTPVVASTTDVTVDEDGFGSANVDSTPLQSDPAEVDSNESLIQTGTAVVNFGNDVPGAPLTGSIALVDTAALDGQLQLLNGAPVTFAPGAGGTLVGSAGGTDVIRISITAAVAGPGPGQVSYTYQVELLQPVEHVAGGGENSALLNDVTFEVTDADGDTAQGTFDVTVVDDVPTANSEPLRTIAEDAVGTISGNVITDSEGNGGADQLGADGGLLTSVTIDGTTTAVAAAGTTTVTTAKGVYTFTSAGAWTFDPAPGQSNASPINADFAYTITDGDGDQASATQPIQITDGAGPSGGDTVELDLDDQNLANGRTPGGPDFETDTLDFTAGSDAIATIVFGTDLSGLNSANLTWTRISGTEIRGTDTATGALVVTLTLARSGDDATVTATLNNNYDAHPTINVDDLVDLGSVQVIATDTDGDTATGTVEVSVSDDIPTIGTTSNVTLAMTTSTTGNFPFAINADDFAPGTAASNFLSATLAGTVGSTAITVTQQPTYTGESGGVATYAFAFTYDSDPTSTADAPVANTGTINFNIGAGTYTVTLANPIQTFTTSQTRNTIEKFSFNLEGSASQSEVVVSKLADDLFIQFTGDADSNPTPLVAGSTAPGTFTNGEIFTAGQTWVSISNEENGVAGDTIQGGEVLDFNLYATNPMSNTSLAPTATATGMTMRLDGVGSEDFVVVLKLFDTVTMTSTTKAIIIGSNDIYRNSDTLPAGYAATLASPLDNNDGFVIIEANDYQQGNPNLVIVGAQLLSSTEDIGGSGIDLNRAVGSGGGSTATKLFGDVENATTSETNDQDVVKIVDIGLVRSVTNTQALSMDFTVTVRDFDNDTATAHLLVNPPTTTTTSSSASIALASESMLAFDSGSSQKFAGNEKIVANSNTLAMTAAAVGFDVQAAARTVTIDDIGPTQSLDAITTSVVREEISVDGGEARRSALTDQVQESVQQTVAKGSSNGGQNETAKGDHGLAGKPVNESGPDKEVASADHGPAKHDSSAGPVAPDVALPSAEALAAAGLASNSQKGGSVEKVIADSLGAANGAPTVDALLDGLPGNGNGGLAALDALASHGAGGVPAWDMGGHGAFNPGADLLFRVEAVVLHHDAVQPVANG